MSAKYRLVGTTDDVVDCARCGKPDLRMTVVLEFLTDGQPTGEVTYFGSSCAARALADIGVRTTAAKVRDAANAAQRQRQALADEARRILDHYGIGHTETLTIERIEEILPAWRSVNTYTGGVLRPLDEARRLFVDCVARNQERIAI